jgi:hypothetical protein
MPNDTPKRGRPRKPPRLHPDSQLVYLRDDPEDSLYVYCRCKACRAKEVRMPKRNLSRNLTCGCGQRAAAAESLAKSRKKRWASE